MSEEEIRLVKSSWRKLRGIDRGIIGDVFYSRLFTKNPSLRKRFPADMEAQNKKLVDMLVYLIQCIDKPEQLEAGIRTVASRHQEMNLETAQYVHVGEALLWTLEKGLGNDWNPALQQAWSHCYDQIAYAMQNSGIHQTL